MDENQNITCTKKICRAGKNSLSVNVTRELRMLGLDKGDAVQVTLKKVQN